MLAASTASATLTITGAVDRAIARSPSVAAAASATAAAEAAHDESRSARLPSFTLSGTGTHYSDPWIAQPIHSFRPVNLPAFDTTLVQAGIAGSYVLFDAGARSAGIEQTSGLVSSASASAEAVRQSAAFRAIAAYATVLGRAAIVEAHDARLRALDAERDRVIQFESAGRAPKVDHLRVDAEVAAATAERVSAAASLDAAERELARLLEVPVDETRAANLVPLDENRAALPDRATLEAEADSSPPLREAHFRSIAQQQSIAFAKSARWPQLVATANEMSFATGSSVLEHDWSAGLQLRFSIFDGGATSARVARANAEADAAGQQYRDARRETAVALDRAIADFEQNRAALASLDKAVEGYDEVARVEKLRLENGAGTQTDFLRAEAELVNARSSLAAAQYGLIVSRAAVARITGVLDSAWVADRFGRQP